MQRKFHYVPKHNKLVQLVVEVQYHVNVIYSLGGRHTHTDVADKSNFKKLGMRLNSRDCFYNLVHRYNTIKLHNK